MVIFYTFAACNYTINNEKLIIMKLHNLFSALAMLLFAVMPLDKVSAQSFQLEGIEMEEQQPSPHVIHVGLGYSYIPGVYVMNADMTFGSIKHGMEYEAGYEYLFRKSWMSLGLICTGHYGGGFASGFGGLGVVSTAPVDLFVHNFTPTVGGHWEWGKHSFKTSLGLGYLHICALGQHLGVERSREVDGGFSSYFSVEYEYRPYSDTGIFVRLHEMDWVKDYTADEWEGVSNYGISVGFNFHL